MAALEIDDAQAAHTQRKRPGVEITFVVRPAMPHRRRHALDQRRCRPTAKFNSSANAAHSKTSDNSQVIDSFIQKRFATLEIKHDSQFLLPLKSSWPRSRRRRKAPCRRPLCT